MLATRWNSTFYMLERASKLKNYITRCWPSRTGSPSLS